MTAVRWAGLGVGAAIVLLALESVVETLIIPRSTSSLLARALLSQLWRATGVLARRVRRYETRDQVWSVAGPVFLLGLLVAWVLLLWVGFALVMWPLIDESARFQDALRLSGSSMFTLGFAVPVGAVPVALSFAAAASGLVVVALQIAYLPTLYSAFNRRETLVTMLEAQGGVPAWGPEILARQELIDNIAVLERLYERWAEWSADVSESHTTYRALIYFRSPAPMRSWLLGLLAVLDAAALHLALDPLTAPPAARSLMRMGIVALQQLGAVVGVAVEQDPRPDDPVALSRSDFDDGLAVLERAGWRAERAPDDAWTHFRGWRVNYETIAYALAAHLDAPPAPWSGPRRAGEGIVPPARPPHRAPSAEAALIRKVTAKRRAARAARDGGAPAPAHAIKHLDVGTVGVTFGPEPAGPADAAPAAPAEPPDARAVGDR